MGAFTLSYSSLNSLHISFISLCSNHTLPHLIKSIVSIEAASAISIVLLFYSIGAWCSNVLESCIKWCYMSNEMHISDGKWIIKRTPFLHTTEMTNHGIWFGALNSSRMQQFIWLPLSYGGAGSNVYSMIHTHTCVGSSNKQHLPSWYWNTMRCILQAHYFFK